MPDGSYSEISSGYSQRFDNAKYYWWDPAAHQIRPTNGGDVPANTGLADYAAAYPSLWQMESFANVLTNDYVLTGSDVTRRMMADQWAHIQSIYSPAVLAGNGAGVTINLSDDAAWQCMYLMHVHMVTGDPLALAYLSEAIAYTTMRFLDSGASGNSVIDGGRTANVPGINYGTSPNNIPFKWNTNGILYATINGPGYSDFGRISTIFEAFLGICSLYVYEHFNYGSYLNYARNVFSWIKAKLRTPAPTASDRKVQGIYETELVLNPSGGTPRDGGAAYLTPVWAYYGKPVRGLDSTYMGGALAMAVLGARLGRLVETSDGDRAAYFAESTSIANAILSTQGYGRSVGGKTLIANTRDPWTEAHMAVPFAFEVLSLPSVNAACAQALVDTTTYILQNQVTGDSRLTADWAGPEYNSYSGRSTWESDYNAQPGVQGGSKQIMTTSETLAMVQAGLVIDRRNHGMPYRGELYRA